MVTYMSSKRVEWIDEARGAAIILVILGHVIGGVDETLGGQREYFTDYHLFVSYASHVYY